MVTCDDLVHGGPLCTRGSCESGRPSWPSRRGRLAGCRDPRAVRLLLCRGYRRVCDRATPPQGRARRRTVRGRGVSEPGQRWYAPRAKWRSGQDMSWRAAIGMGTFNLFLCALAAAIPILGDSSGLPLVASYVVTFSTALAAYVGFAHAAFNTRSPGSR